MQQNRLQFDIRHLLQLALVCAVLLGTHVRMFLSLWEMRISYIHFAALVVAVCVSGVATWLSITRRWGGFFRAVISILCAYLVGLAYLGSVLGVPYGWL